MFYRILRFHAGPPYEVCVCSHVHLNVQYNVLTTEIFPLTQDIGFRIVENGSAHQKEDFGVNLVITFSSCGSGLRGTDIVDNYVHIHISIHDKIIVIIIKIFTVSALILIFIFHVFTSSQFNNDLVMNMSRTSVVLATLIVLHLSLSLHRLPFAHIYRVFIHTKEIKLIVLN